MTFGGIDRDSISAGAPPVSLVEESGAFLPVLARHTTFATRHSAGLPADRRTTLAQPRRIRLATEARTCR